MKTIKIAAIIAFIGTACFIQSCVGYVSSQPDQVVIVRPARPYANAIWIDGDYVWRGGRYVYVNGYWRRSRPGRIYTPGYWGPHRYGHRWHRGHW